MKTFFIADAHLKGLTDPSQARLAEFLGKLSGAGCLVILGDLFDFWIGYNDVVGNHYRPVLSALKGLRDSGTRIIYLEGNHDFAMGEYFTGELGAEVFPDSCEVDLDGSRFYLSHGDTIRMTRSHSLWRWFLRTPLFRLITRVVTPGLAWRIGQRLSKTSRQYNSERGMAIEKDLKGFARAKVGGGTDAVVFGHSHVPGVTDIICGGVRGVYANPGSWADSSSYLVYEGGGFRVEQYKGQAPSGG